MMTLRDFTWSMLDVSTTTTTIHEHSYQLQSHNRILWIHAQIYDLKNVSIQRVLKILISLDIFHDKISIQSKLVKLKKRVLKKIKFKHREFIFVIIKLTLESRKQKRERQQQMKIMKTASSTIKNLNLTMKNVIKNVKEHLCHQTSKQIFVQINEIIKFDREISLVSFKQKNQAIIFNHLQSEDVVISTRNEKNIVLLNWIIAR